jgi:hypothetical protein
MYGMVVSAIASLSGYLSLLENPSGLKKGQSIWRDRVQNRLPCLLEWWMEDDSYLPSE